MLWTLNVFQNLFHRSCLSRVDRLKQLITKKKADKKSKTFSSKNSESKDTKEADNNSDGTDDDDDSDIDGMFDWRAKMA